MSITKMRGCFSTLGPPVAILIGIVLVVGFLMTSNRGNQAQETQRLGDEAVTYDGTAVYQAELLKRVDLVKSQRVQEKSSSDQLPELSPYEMLNAYEETAAGALQQLAIQSLLKKEGIEVDEDEIEAWAADFAERQVQDLRGRADMQKQIGVLMAEQKLNEEKKKDPKSPAAKKAEQDLEQARKQNTDELIRQALAGATPEQYKQRIVQEYASAAANDPTAKREILLQIGLERLQNKYMSRVDTSDQAVKNSYDKFTYQQIQFSGPDAKQKAETVRAKIEAGMDFKEAAQQFSELKDPSGKVTVQPPAADRLQIETNPATAPIAALKPGQTSEVIEVPGSAWLYKLIEVKPAAPADFDKQKPTRAQTMRTQQAAANLSAAIENATRQAEQDAQWKDEGWKLAYDFRELRSGEKGRALQGPANKQERVQAYKDAAQKTQTIQTAAPEIPALVRFAALNQLQVELPDEKDNMKQDLLEAYAQAAQIAPTSALRIELAQLYLAENMAEQALETLTDAAQAAYPPGPKTQPIIEKIQALAVKAANFAPPGSKKVETLQNELKQWHEDQAEIKRQEEEQKKFEEEEQKKADEEEKAKANQSPKAKGPAGSPSSQPR